MLFLFSLPTESYAGRITEAKGAFESVAEIVTKTFDEWFKKGNQAQVLNPHVLTDHFRNKPPIVLRAVKINFRIESDENKNLVEEITDFFSQIDKRYKLALKDKLELKKLKSEWLKRALIKKVPKNLIKSLKKSARKNNKEFNEEDVLKILKGRQKKSFLKWFNHIMSPDVDTPPWFRYLLLEDLLEIGKYSPKKNSFAQRTDETVEDYPDLDREAFAKVYDSLKNYYEDRVNFIEEDVLELIRKDERGAFATLYAKRIKFEEHVVGEHYKDNYAVAIKRFGIESDPNKSPKERVTDYFTQIDKRYSLAFKDESELEKLRSEWLELALIKEVPKSHIDNQRAIARQRGREADFDREFNREDELKTLKAQQQESFLRWFDYIMGPDVDIPHWLRHILLKDLLEIGTYNTNKSGFAQRTSETAGSYPGLNSEAFAKVYGSLENYYKGRVDSIEDGVLEKIKENEGRAFATLYAQRLNELEKLSVWFDLKVTEGEWVKYERGNMDHAKDLFDSLQDQNTGWCTASTCSMATSQVKDGDFYVYYSEDFKGESTAPRIAIRMEGEIIIEVRGRAEGQNLDLEMLKTSILEDKLKKFGDEGEKYKQRFEDMNLLTKLEYKVESGEELSLEELKFLYEIDRKIQGFGYDRDTRIDEIISKRDKIEEDYALIFNVKKSEVSSKKEDVLSGKAKVFIGDLKLGPNDDLSRVRLETITGNAEFGALESAKGLEYLKHIGGDASFDNLISAEGLEHLEHIGGNANFERLTSAKGLESLNYVGGHANFKRLTNAEGLEELTYIGRNAEFGALESAKGLRSLNYVGGNASFRRLTNAKGLRSLNYVGENALFDKLTNAEGLEELTYVGRSASFRRLTNAKGLKKLSHIGGNAYFERLTSAKDLENFNVGGDAVFGRSLTSAKDLNRTDLDDNFNFYDLSSDEDLGIVEK